MISKITVVIASTPHSIKLGRRTRSTIAQPVARFVKINAKYVTTSVTKPLSPALEPELPVRHAVKMAKPTGAHRYEINRIPSMLAGVIRAYT